MSLKSKILIKILEILCISTLCIDLILSMTKVNLLTKVEKNPKIANQKLETEKVLYVSTTGKDNNSGESEAEAKLTLQAAINTAKDYIKNEDVTIKVGKGHHYIYEQINIDNLATGGENGYKLTIEGSTQGKTTIDGGVQITTPWEIENEVYPNIWVTQLEPNLSINGLYVNGELKKVAQDRKSVV